MHLSPTSKLGYLSFKAFVLYYSPHSVFECVTNVIWVLRTQKRTCIFIMHIYSFYLISVSDGAAGGQACHRGYS